MTTWRSARMAMAVGAAAALAAPAAADAAVWRRVSPLQGASVLPLTLARTPNGDLHVGYIHQNTVTDNDVWDARVRPSGAVAQLPIARHWYGVSSAVALTNVGSTVVAWFGGHALQNDVAGTQVATAPAGTFGAPTLVHQTAGDFADTADNGSAGTAEDGTPWYVYHATGQLRVQRGTTPGGATYNLEPASYQSYDGALGFDGGTNAVWLVSWGLGNGSTGNDRAIFAQSLAPTTGAALAPAVRLAHGAGLALPDGFGQTLAVSGRGHGHPGVWALYWNDTLNVRRLLLRRLGTSSTKVLVRAKGVATTLGRPVLSHDRAGRLWAVWVTHGASTTSVSARRSNPQGTTWGPQTSIPVPSSAFSAIDYLVANAARTDGVLDVAATLTTNGGSSAAYVARILPPLAVVPSTQRVHRPTGGKVVIAVSDPDAIAGAVVRVSGPSGFRRTLHTDAKGHATLVLPRGAALGTYRIAVTASAHGGGGATLRVVP